MLADEVSEFLHSVRQFLKKGLGQHFLIDEHVLEAIVGAADIQPHDHVLEIGAGIGILTRELLKKAKKVTAIEIDRSLIPLLQIFLTRHLQEKSLPKHLNLIEGNALHTNFPGEPYKMAANIPYQITSPLLRHTFLESAVTPLSLTLLIQKEVAENICDQENGDMLTTLVGLFGTPHYIFSVSPDAFLPPPKVDSAVIHIDCFPQPKADRQTIEKIFTLTKIAFSRKRKMLSNSLGELPNGMEILTEAGIDPKRRPQTLSVEEWMQLAKNF